MASETPHGSTEVSQTPETNRLVRRGAAAVVFAAVANALVTTIALAAGVAPDLFQLSYGPVLFFTVLGTVGATVVYAVLSQLVADHDRWFVAVAAVVLVASVIPDFTYIPNEPGGSLVAGAVLASMHVLAAVIAVVALTGRLPIGD